MVFLRGICIEDERIKVVKQWSKRQSISDIYVFFGFIQGFSQITALLISILKTSKSIKSTIRPGKGTVRVGGDGKKQHSGRVELNNKNEVGGNKIKNNKVAEGKNY